MTVVTTCPFPDCDGELDDLVVDGPSADAFCGKCDRPLFWQVAVADADEEADADKDVDEGQQSTVEIDHAADPHRRHPEYQGVESEVEQPCWQCREMVLPATTKCHRCGAVIPQPVDERGEGGDGQTGDITPCGSPTGEATLAPVNVPAWLLVLLGGLLAVAIGCLIAVSI